ncbi:hypothetical protein M758_1G193900 [Ceratodon purpureus]|nr:hypothetical protein M758_1G193900 [Ceratodon purpureus]
MLASQMRCSMLPHLCGDDDDDDDGGDDEGGMEVERTTRQARDCLQLESTSEETQALIIPGKANPSQGRQGGQAGNRVGRVDQGESWPRSDRQTLQCRRVNGDSPWAIAGMLLMSA